MQKLIGCFRKPRQLGVKVALCGVLCLLGAGNASAQFSNSVSPDEMVSSLVEQTASPAATETQMPGTTLHDLILGGKVAVTLPMKALDEKSWRQMRIRGVYGDYETVYTRGLVVRVGDVNWLVIYKPADYPNKTLSPDQFRRQQFSGTGGPTADTMLSMWLVRTDTLRNIDDIRPYSKSVLTTPLSGSELPNHYFWALSVKYLQKLAMALANYRQEYGYMPPMTNTVLVKKALLPYAENETIFTQPGTTQPYLPNPLLSGRMYAHLRRRMSVVAFYEAEPAADGKRAIMQLNGKVRRVDAATWRKLAKISELDEGGIAK